MQLMKNCIFKEADMIDFMPDEDSFANNEEDSNDNEDEENGNSEGGIKSSAMSLGLKYWTVRRCSAYVLERISGKIKFMFLLNFDG